jgi:hypothetical protein
MADKMTIHLTRALRRSPPLTSSEENVYLMALLGCARQSTGRSLKVSDLSDTRR